MPRSRAGGQHVVQARRWGRGLQSVEDVACALFGSSVDCEFTDNAVFANLGQLVNRDDIALG